MNSHLSRSAARRRATVIIVALLMPSIGAVNVSPVVGAAAVRQACVASGITGVSPDYGTANTVVAISGCGLTGATEVLFGNVPASFHVNSNTSITAYAPHGEAAGATVPV
jgi:hypothetical protein